MLFLEELVDVVIAEEGQTLMGLDYLYDTMGLPMTKIEKIFKKALSEYSERRPMKVTETFTNSGTENYIQLPDDVIACRIARYGVIQNIPRFYLPVFEEQNIEFDPYTHRVTVWPPVYPIRLTMSKKYQCTKNILIEQNFDIPVARDEFTTTLNTMFAGKTLTIQRQSTDSSGDPVILSMQATGEIIEEEELGEIGIVTRKAVLSGSLGTGTVDLDSLNVELEFHDGNSVAPLFFSYYPKYLVCKEMDIGNYIFTKLFASKLLTALASLRAQSTQEKLHNINLTSDNLYERAVALKDEVHTLLKSTISFGNMAPM